MKAYTISDKDGAVGYSIVVFAETRGKAIAIAQHSDEFGWYGMEYIDFRAKRIPALDKYYKGKSEMDWYNMEDRVAMVKDAGFTCSYEYEIYDDCDECPAKQWCDRYKTL